MLATTSKPKVDVLKSNEFNGMRSAKVVEKFLWGMEQYFHAKGIIDDATKVNIAIMYFTNVSLLWWHHRSIDER